MQKDEEIELDDDGDMDAEDIARVRDLIGNADAEDAKMTVRAPAWENRSGRIKKGCALSELATTCIYPAPRDEAVAAPIIAIELSDLANEWKRH